MACLQPPYLSSTNLKLSTPKPTLFPRTHFLKTFKVSSSADSSPYPPQNLSTIGQNPVGTASIEDGEEGAKQFPEPIRIAMEKAMEYKRNKGIAGAALSEVEPTNVHGSGETTEAGRIIWKRPKEYKGFVGGDEKIGKVDAEPTNEDDGEETKKIPDRVKSALEKAREYKMNKGLVRAVENEVKTEVGRIPVEPANEDDGEETNIPERVKSALEKAREYKLNKGHVRAVKNEVKTEVGQSPVESANEDDGEETKIPDRVKSALEKAREYKLNKGHVRAVKNEAKTEVGQVRDKHAYGDGDQGTIRIPIEIKIGIERAIEYKKKKGLISASDNTKNGTNEVTKDDDFLEVEIIVGDATKFGNNNVIVEQLKEDRENQRYKPKITKWIQ